MNLRKIQLTLLAASMTLIGASLDGATRHDIAMCAARLVGMGGDSGAHDRGDHVTGGGGRHEHVAAWHHTHAIGGLHGAHAAGVAHAGPSDPGKGSVGPAGPGPGAGAGAGRQGNALVDNGGNGETGNGAIHGDGIDGHGHAGAGGARGGGGGGGGGNPVTGGDITSLFNTDPGNAGRDLGHGGASGDGDSGLPKIDVPEPGMLGLSGLALVGLIAARRRRRRPPGDLTITPPA